MTSSNVNKLTRSALMVALIAVCAQITIPLPWGVPMTLQTLAVALCGYLLGPLNAMVVIGVYLLLGLFGLPVFSAFGAGAAVLLGRTGGFLYGFFALAGLCGLAGRQERKLFQLLLGVPGLLLCHLAGTIQFALIAKMGFWASALLVSVPYLLKDLVSVALASRLAVVLNKALHLRLAR